MTVLQAVELLHHAVQIVGLPFAVFVFLRQQRQALRNEEAQLFQGLLDQYVAFSHLLVQNADLGILSRKGAGRPLTDEQEERRTVLFDALVTMFERAFVLLHPRSHRPEIGRLWAPWGRNMGEWLAREDFARSLPELLTGVDEEFRSYVLAKLPPRTAE